MVKPFLSWSTVSLTPAKAIGRRRTKAIKASILTPAMVLVTTVMGSWHQNALPHVKAIGQMCILGICVFSHLVLGLILLETESLNKCDCVGFNVLIGKSVTYVNVRTDRQTDRQVRTK